LSIGLLLEDKKNKINMLKAFFSKKSTSTISLYLGMNRLAICRLDKDKISLLAQSDISSDLQWEEQFAAWVDEHKLQKSQVSVVVSRDFYQTFDIEKPKVAEGELMASLPFTIKDLVTDSIFDLVVDYYDRPVMANKGEQITAVCIAKQKVVQIRDMLLKHGMQLKEITIEELSLTRLLGDREEVNLLLSQQNNELLLTVVKEGMLFFSHRLRGFNELLALPLTDVEDSLLDNLSLELQRVLDYINSQLHLSSVSHLYLAVICPDIALLAEKLGDYLAKNVVPLGDKEQYDYSNLLAYGVLMAGETE
jgi:MSHA biogenesis protein MshI